MARLVSFIAPAQSSLDMAFYDMRFSDGLKQQLLSALRQRAAAGVQIRICYDADKSQVPDVSAGQGPGALRDRGVRPVARVPIPAHRRHEAHAQQIHRARPRRDLDGLDEHDGRRLHIDGKQHRGDHIVRDRRLLHAGFRAALAKTEHRKHRQRPHRAGHAPVLRQTPRPSA